jgi:recombinational DNA repair ATPase RecF
MVRLRKIEITGFRGATESFVVDLSSNCRSIAIFGENAAGKSSIADAIEWFYTDRVEHLWRENCKEAALRNTRVDAKTSSSVSLEFSTGTLNCRKTLTPDFKTLISNKTTEFKQYLSKVSEGYERLTLRNLDLLSFVVKRKADKRQELERIIGYGALDEFRDVVRSTLNQLEKSTDFVSAKSSFQENQREILRIARTSVSTEKELYAAAEKLGVEAGLTLKIDSAEGYQAAIESIQTKIHDKEKAARKIALSDCKQRCEDLARKVEQARGSFDSFSQLYAVMIRSEEQLKQIRLAELLELGKQAIDGHLVDHDTCPLCLQPKDWESLAKELNDRLARLLESKSQFDAAYSQKNQCIAKLNDSIRTGYELTSSATKNGIEGAFLRATEEYSVFVKALEREIGESFAAYAPLILDLTKASASILSVLNQEIERLESEVATMALSKEEQRLLDGFQAMSNLRTFFQKFRTASESLQRFQVQIQTLSKIRSDFSVVHGSALQKALDLMSGDISKFYLAMHPSEEVDDVRLTVLEDGVEFDYKFHGERVYPPLKYLSESHLNSLGIAAFLASVRLFNSVNGFFVLDDIVTSFDANHRVRLLHLLKDQFSDWQIILLTHEPFWFELIKRELPPAGWNAFELEAASGSGIRLKLSTRDLKEQIISKRKLGTLTANELRTATERILKDIGFGLEVKMAFRFNDQNERRMAGELLSELRSTLKKKSSGTLSNPAFSKLETSGLIATTGSHDSGPVLSSGDIVACCDDVLVFDEQFLCKDCGTYVSVERFVEHENKIYCRCGKKLIDWKEK